MIYLDSSVLLELYLGGPRAPEARGIPDEGEAKVASWLLLVEVPIVLRRALHQPRDRAALARCRALDAIHACTALLLREWTGHAVRLETFDERLADLAGELHLG